jgi:predicted HTH domain antitoxin
MATVTIDVPDDALTALDRSPEELSREMRLASALFWYTQGRISAEKAAEFAGVSRVEFLEAVAAAKVPVPAADADASIAEPGSASPDPFEEHYQRIGWWKGPHATTAARQGVRDFWASLGPRGARWLVERLRNEWHVDLLSGVANLLADLGEVSLKPILDELELEASRDQEEALLKALAWLGAAGTTAGPLAGQLTPILAVFLTHEDPDLREAACRATSLLAPGDAHAVLEARLAAEPSAEVRQAIAERIAQLPSSQG